MSLLVAVLLAAPPANAQILDRIVAGPAPSSYATTSVSIAEGESLRFLNLDLTAPHDVFSVQQSGGQPLFRTPVIAAPGDVPIDGIEQVPPGSYRFICTIHPWMSGSLTVTGGGGGGGGGGGAPEVEVAILDSKLAKVRRKGALRTRVTVDRPASVRVQAKAGKGKKSTTIAKGRRSLSEAGASRLAAKLTKAGKRLLKRSKRLKVTVRATAESASGDKSKARATKTLR